MKKTFYTDYVRHMLRHYCRFDCPSDSSIDADNWLSCDFVFGTLTRKYADCVKLLYGKGYHISDHFDEAVEATGLSQGELWEFIYRLERNIAVKRGLYNGTETTQRRDRPSGKRS